MRISALLTRSNPCLLHVLKTQVPAQPLSKAKKVKVDPKTAVVPTTSKDSKDALNQDKKDAGNALEGINTWLMKSEPDTFSIDDLIHSKDSTSPWEGVRNHEAKNLMKNNMRVGHSVLFYHSNTKEPGIVAMATIAKEAYPDHFAFDSKSPYYDGKSSKDDPRWFMVDVKFVRKLKRTLTLKELQMFKDKELKDMKLLTRGRLSVQPVTDKERDFILSLEERQVEEK
ncbi:Thymocyte nuclear protein 1 [Lunasporangiospora selenospora]|uniref:Thymocyte nuclear protein 1 n=1 Tax=Lunasporangiospora selenospora TaxID=979761 RepID=A0A9P6KI62_9FUNG|nr:Thymocyte nuclear protein 1 [Lunasporangiospora selenospora]